MRLIWRQILGAAPAPRSAPLAGWTAREGMAGRGISHCGAAPMASVNEEACPGGLTHTGYGQVS
jgi:hypothetical protein